MAAVVWWFIGALRKQFYLYTPSELAFDDTDPAPKWVSIWMKEIQITATPFSAVG